VNISVKTYLTKRSPVFCACLFVLLFFISIPVAAQSQDSERPVPILSGAAGYFTNVNGGQTELVPEINPVLLVPLGNRWLIESRAEFQGEFERPEGGGPYGGKVEQEIDYLELDYIVNPYVTVTLGRYLTPFGMYNERMYPIWIRDLQRTPLIYPLATGSGDGAMLRGGFRVNAKANLNYSAYFSALSNVNKFESNRMVGLRSSLFFPGPRIEVGGSWQKELQEERPNAFGFHFAWQPTPLPLNLRAEYARSNDGSGYWIEGAYRLGQLPFWKAVMRKTEIVGRAQQFFSNGIEEDEAKEYGLPDVNTQQGDFGLNYYIRDGLKATGSYSRQFSSDGRFNLWTVGIAYRFAFPLWKMEAQ
jgi:hypothetical protein